MATFNYVLISVVWSWTYAEPLPPPLGRLVTDHGYRAAVAEGQQASAWHFPWVVAIAEGDWSRFWSGYLGTPALTRHISPDEAWDLMVPLSSPDRWNCTGPAGTE